MEEHFEESGLALENAAHHLTVRKRLVDAGPRSLSARHGPSSYSSTSDRLWREASNLPTTDRPGSRKDSRSERLQVFDEVLLFRFRQAEPLDGVVVVDDVEQCRESPVVVEAPLRVSPE